MKNSKFTSSLLLVVAALTLQSCYEYEPAPSPVTLRAEKLTYSFGSSKSYRTLTYDAGGRLTTIVSGLTNPEDGTFEFTHKLSYSRNLLRSAKSDDQTVISYEYSYSSSDILTETNAYMGNDLYESHKYSYDGLGRLTKDITWTRNATTGTLQKNYQIEYKYDSHDNLIEERRAGYNGSAFVPASTIAYINFDTKKNSEHFFMSSLHHPFVIFFQNNPQTQKLTNANGTSAEQKFTYEYNDMGLAIKKIIAGRDASFEYKFELMN
ncbi:MAG: hypothetical protein RIF36_11220 [Imperialibacter sp.]|uniref:hypothetical protein n=1 Tax=Imperialibacter sp. TaxID=2038411 RepID=UPI0032EF15D7